MTSTGAGATAGPGYSLAGGIHFWGLCARCNGLQGEYDGAYGDLVSVVSPGWIKDASVPAGLRYRPPADRVVPGAVARSVLIGFFGLNPNLRTLYPDLATALLARDGSVQLPAGIGLRFAMCRGRRARVSGSIGGLELMRRRIGDRPLGVMTMAELYFPPLAWQLAATGPSLLDIQGWADVSHWFLLDCDRSLPLNAAVAPLPFVMHPRHDPEISDWWCELLSDEITSVIECDDVEPMLA